MLHDHIYLKDVYQCMKKAESMSPDLGYSEREWSDLVNFVAKVCITYRMTSPVIYRSINIIRRYVKAANPTNREMTAITCIMIAAKHEERCLDKSIRCMISNYCRDRKVDRQDLRTFEAAILNAIDFKVSEPTVHFFIGYTLACIETKTKAFALEAQYYTKCSMYSQEVLTGFCPSDIAMACVYMAAGSHQLPFEVTEDIVAISRLINSNHTMKKAHSVKRKLLQ